MKSFFRLVVLGRVLSVGMFFLLTHFVQAGLLNHEAEDPNPQPSPQQDQVPAQPIQPQQHQQPQWKQNLPKAVTREEKRYDVNHDGYLQSAEVRVFLRDVAEEAQASGIVKIESDILKEYDSNMNGEIDPQEAQKIVEDTRSYY